jgi:hypothetical protein
MGIDKLCSYFLCGNELTDESLQSIGYSKELIKEFKSNGTLRKDKDGKYYVSDKALYVYFKSNLKTQDKEYLDIILDKILEINPNNEDGLYQTFYSGLKEGNIEASFNAFEKLYRLKSNIIRSYDAKYCLYLFSKLGNIGDLYDEIKDITLNDIRVPRTDRRYTDADLHNKSRELSLNYQFEEAVNIVFPTTGTGKLSFQELTIKTLLNRVVHAFKNGHNYKECIYQYRYQDALYSINQRGNLSEYETLVKKLLEFITNMPEQIYVDLDHNPGLWESIEANDFYGAYEMSQNYNRDKGINDEDSPLTLLLGDIINILDQMQQYQSEEEYEAAQEQVEEVIEEPVVEEVVEESKETENDNIIDKLSFISELISQGLSFEDALYHACYDAHTNNYITLLYAREAYRTGNTKIGDKLLSMYNKSTSKDQENNKLYKNIIESKKFLPYRESDLSIQITIPKKLVRTQ